MTTELHNVKRRDRRANPRFAMKWPFVYRSESSWKRARMLDMSSSGILAELPEALPTGGVLEISMDWPGLYHNKPTMRLHLKAAIVRTDAGGTGMRILRHEFRCTDRAKAVA